MSGALFPEDYLPCRSWCASSVRLGRLGCFWLLGSREGYPGGGTTRPDFTDFWMNQAFSSYSCCYLVVLLVVAAAVVAAVPIALLLDFGGTIVLMLKDGRLVGTLGDAFNIIKHPLEVRISQQGGFSTYSVNHRQETPPREVNQNCDLILSIFVVGAFSKGT